MNAFKSAKTQLILLPLHFVFYYRVEVIIVYERETQLVSVNGYDDVVAAVKEKWPCLSHFDLELPGCNISLNHTYHPQPYQTIRVLVSTCFEYRCCNLNTFFAATKICQYCKILSYRFFWYHEKGLILSKFTAHL